MKRRVMVAMSGGVDSSVAALLLLRQGYEVVGITFQLYDYSRLNRSAGKGSCCSIEDVQDARSVCKTLGIQHFLVDSKAHFQDRVIKYFTDSYKSGLTPNPCVACNTFIKFDELDHFSKSAEADYFATGHYARLLRDGTRSYIARAKDNSKDQSYFLVGLKEELRDKLLFPLGDYTKEEIRNLALEQGIPTSQKPESMEICFVPGNDYRKFLAEETDMVGKPGEVVDEAGHILGQHRGIHSFTIGQKKGLGPLGLHDYYVVKLNPVLNQVIVGPDRSLYSEGLVFRPLDFKELEPFFSKPLTVKIRSRADFKNCRLLDHKEVGGQMEVRAQFDDLERAVSPGQFAVFYCDDKVVGGGPILRPVASFENELGSTPGIARNSLCSA